MEIKKIKLTDLLKLDSIFDIFDYQYSTTEIEKSLQKNSLPWEITGIITLVSKDLYPPIPVSNNIIIWGFTLLRLSKAISKEYLLCRILGEQTPVEMITTALSMENRAGKYSMEEQARLFKLMGNLKIQLDLKETKKITPLITGHFDPNWTKRIQQYTKFSPPLKSLVDNNLIDYKTALKVQDLPPEIFTLLDTDKLSFSERRIVLNLFYEIVKRDKLESSRAIEEFFSIIRSKNPLRVAKRKRFPKLSEMEEEYRALKGKYLKGKGIEIELPDHFEGDKITAKFSFKSKEEFQTRIKELENLRDRIDEFFKILR